MKPKTKAVLKVLACYWIASVCMVAILGGFGEGHPDVAFSNSIVVMVLIAPLVPFITVFSFAFAIFDPMALAGVLGALLAFALPRVARNPAIQAIGLLCVKGATLASHNRKQ